MAPLWATDQLLGMKFVVRAFPQGGVAGSSELRPQHLLDSLNSSDSAAKAGLLDAKLTLVTHESQCGPPTPRCGAVTVRAPPHPAQEEGCRRASDRVGDTLAG